MDVLTLRCSHFHVDEWQVRADHAFRAAR